MVTTPGTKVTNIDLIEEGINAIEAIEELLSSAGLNQLNEVHAGNLSTLLYVVRDRMRRGVDGPMVSEVKEIMDAFGMRPVPGAERVADAFRQELGERVAPANERPCKGVHAKQGNKSNLR